MTETPKCFILLFSNTNKLKMNMQKYTMHKRYVSNMIFKTLKPTSTFSQVFYNTEQSKRIEIQFKFKIKRLI